MEALNLLKFWRNAGRTDNIAGIDYVNSDYHKSGGFANNQSPETEFDSDNDSDDSFFELELINSSSSSSSSEQLVESPRDVFRNGRVFPLDSPISSSNNNKPQSPSISLPKFKMFMLRFKKSTTFDSPVEIGQSKRFSVKSNVDEMPPVLTRDNSLRTKLLRENMEDSSKKSEKDLLNNKYLKVIINNGYKMKFKDGSPVILSPARKVSVEKQMNRSSGFKNKKNMVKSKSGVGIMTPSPVNRRDDSLLQDGIQGAILHCKRSYNSPAKELSRCASDPSHEKSVTPARDSELMKRSSI